MAKVAIVLGEDFEDSEFDTPRSALVDAGHDVVVVGVEKGAEVVGKRGEVRQRVDAEVDEIDLRDIDALVIPGGYSPDHLRTDEGIVRFVKDIVEWGTTVAAICDAGSLLIEADVVAGRTLTSWPSIRTDLVNAGAAWMDSEVVLDGNLITSRNPDDLPAFTNAVLGALRSGSQHGKGAA
ncbi:MAG: type 1 glutamine amidotransferase [Acidimicrobiia bacterium]|nr:type 1 glutamine amidotransferase [Acidimicrobiia bacterium]